MFVHILVNISIGCHIQTVFVQQEVTDTHVTLLLTNAL